MSRQQISTIQRAIDRRMRALGASRRPIDAALHLFAVQHEMAAVQAQVPVDAEQLSRLATELFETSTSLAARYGVTLTAGYRARGLSIDLDQAIDERQRRDVQPDLTELLLRIGRAVDEIAHTVAYYDHDADPPRVQTSLTGAISALHEALLDLCAAHRIDVGAMMDAILESSPPQRLRPVFNPADAACLTRFRPVQDQTLCPFARRAKLWGAPDYEPAQGLADNVRSALPYLHSFTKVAQAEILDGFLFSFPTDVVGREFDAVPTVVRTLLTTLIAHDPTRPRAREPEDVTEESWRFRFADEEYFVNVIAPHYRDTHPRHSYQSREHIFVLLQPESSFHAHIPKPVYHSRRNEIRRIFDQAFQGYTLDDAEAHKFVLPLDHDGTPVRWYHSAPLSEESA